MKQPKLNKKQYDEELNKALESMKIQDFQRFLMKNDFKLAMSFIKTTEMHKKITICKLIVKSNHFEGTEQKDKAIKYLTKHGVDINADTNK